MVYGLRKKEGEKMGLWWCVKGQMGDMNYKV